MFCDFIFKGFWHDLRQCSSCKLLFDKGLVADWRSSSHIFSFVGYIFFTRTVFWVYYTGLSMQDATERRKVDVVNLKQEIH